MLNLLKLFSILSVILFSDCEKKEKMEFVESHTVLSSSDNTGIRYLALGDSYTKAECEIPENSYPYKLSEKFKAKGIKISSRTIIAQTGWRTDNLKDAVNAAALEDTFDLVSLLIGVNNQFQGKSPENYRIEFRDLLETAIYYAKGRKDKVFVLSIPDYGATPYGSRNSTYIGQQINLFNAINKEVTNSMGVKYFDITPISREARKDDALTCTDNLHPSGKMYDRWVALMLPEVEQMIAKP
jgi:lysophospholipase L1-like esterase